MTTRNALRLCMALSVALAGASALVSAQGLLLPSSPKKAFGASISPAWDGWYTNEDGTHTFLIGYYNRNWTSEVDVPIGPDNHFEPGEPDRGQPTHFMPNRGFGMFTVTVPKDTPPTEKIWWVLTVNGVKQRVPFHRISDYNITPQQASEEGPGGKYNTPPVLRFAEKGPAIQSPVASVATAIHRSAVVGRPMPLDFWIEDDGLFASGTNAPLAEEPEMVKVHVTKYRGPAPITVTRDHEKVTTVTGGKAGEPYTGRLATTVTFSQPGDYMLHVTVNDLSGPGGGATGCCWTTSLITVTVSDDTPTTVGR
ncbi:MAG: hypothetical protein R2712_04845 [Vicinamibacterales bacterium]